MVKQKALEAMRDELAQVFPAGKVYDDNCKSVVAYAEKAIYQRWREYALADIALKEAEDVVGMAAALAGRKIGAQKKAKLEEFANNAVREYAGYRKALHDNAMKKLSDEPENTELVEHLAYLSIALRFDIWQRARLNKLDERSEKLDEAVKEMRHNGFSVGVCMEHFADIDVKQNPEKAKFYENIRKSVLDGNYDVPMHQ